jgi:hypothetical protein
MGKIAAFPVMLLIAAALAIGAAGCGEGEESPTPAPSPAPFALKVIPEHMDDTVPGQSCVFLVSVADEGEGEGKGDSVSISASVADAVAAVSPEAMAPGQVGEVTVIPDEASTGKTLSLTIQAEREGLERQQTATLTVQQQSHALDELAVTAADMRDKFVPWLAANHPDLGITAETEWAGTVVRPNIMVVMYYLFLSDEWEMGIQWHVTIPPHDWTRIYLRDRDSELAPSRAFEIPSTSAQGPYQATEIEPPEAVWR